MKISEVINSQIKGFWGIDFSDKEKGTPVIKTNNMTYEGVIDYSDICFRNIQKETIGKNYLQKGDLLVEKSGGTKTHSVGYVNFFNSDNNTFVCNNFIVGLRPNHDIVDSKYLFYQLRFMYENGYFSDCYNKTTGIQNLKANRYLEKDIIVVDKNTQKSIATELDKFVESINLKKKQILYFDKLVKSEFIEMFGNFETNSMNWEIKPFSYFASIDGNMTSDFEKYADYPHIGIGNIEKDTGNLIAYKTIREDNVISGKYLFTPEHIIYSKIRPNLNKVALPTFDGLCSVDAYPILPNKENCNRIFLAIAMRSDYFRGYILQFSSRANIPKVNRKEISGFTMPLPPLSLQNKFAEFVELTDKSKFIVQKQIEDLQELLDKKMDEYFG